MTKWIWFFLFMVFLAVTGAHGSKLKHIGPGEAAELQARFLKASSLDGNDLKGQGSWDCKLYGMRSRMQVQGKREFYSFASSQDEAQIKNSGAQLIRTYKIGQLGLVGERGPFRDLVRKEASGRLISEFSLKKKTNPQKSQSLPNDLKAVGGPGRVVIAYAECLSGPDAPGR